MKAISQIVIASSLLALAGSAGLAQTDKMAPVGQGEATIYRDYNFQGPAVYVGEAKPNLGLAWPVRSIRVRSGTWELCARTRYRSPCARVSADEADLRRVSRLLYAVQSMRPLNYGPPVEQDPPAGQSLRGMGAEFFAAPGRNGRRIQSCSDNSGSANCAARTADDYCASVGWNGAAYQSQETVGRRIYLVDVLCVRSGF